MEHYQNTFSFDQDEALAIAMARSMQDPDAQLAQDIERLRMDTDYDPAMYMTPEEFDLNQRAFTIDGTNLPCVIDNKRFMIQNLGASLVIGNRSDTNLCWWLCLFSRLQLTNSLHKFPGVTNAIQLKSMIASAYTRCPTKDLMLVENGRPDNYYEGKGIFADLAIIEFIARVYGFKLFIVVVTMLSQTIHRELDPAISGLNYFVAGDNLLHIYQFGYSDSPCLGSFLLYNQHYMLLNEL